MTSRVVTSVFTVPPTELLGSPATRPAWIAGSENALVQIAAEVVLQHDDRRRWMNPLVFCGSSGAGKTSLVQILADEKRRLAPKSNVLHEVATDFARSYAHAVDTDSIADFRAKHTRCDLLVLDDLHRLAGKAAAQQELIAVIDAMIRRGALVLLTLKNLPAATRGLLPMLASRISQGLTLSLALPGVEARDALLRVIAAQQGLLLPEELAEQLAMAIAARPAGSLSATQLRHFVIELARWFADQPASRAVEVDVETPRAPRGRPAKLPPLEAASNPPAATSAADFIAQLLSLRTADLKTTLRQVTQLVARHYQLSPADLRGQSRQQSLVQGRSLAMFIARSLTEASFADVGKFFGNRDHTTVLHACRKIQSQLEKDVTLKSLVDEISVACLASETRHA